MLNTILNACVKESLWRRAIGILKTYDSHNLIPNAHTFEILIGFLSYRKHNNSYNDNNNNNNNK
jgi:pentatricopeptide repeat protein